ncbi:hypothetical protein C2E23DRAFT_890435 [Lenzites betulinus]|nr:hypothetical protein C2E23DRAFT_890435 [Lenzites betulinus]
MFLRLLLLAQLLLLVRAAPDELRLKHRLFHPSLPAAPFSDRATVQLTGSGPTAQARLVPSETLADDFLQFTAAAEGLKDALYQVALDHPGDSEQAHWASSSVLAVSPFPFSVLPASLPALQTPPPPRPSSARTPRFPTTPPCCHLPYSTAESFTLHLDQNGTPFSLDYFVGPIPHNGACPKKSRKPGAQSSPAELGPIANTTVVLRSPSFPPLYVPSPALPVPAVCSRAKPAPAPQLRVPPPVTAEGKPVQAPKEKSFLEKYWMYIAIGLVALIAAPGGPGGEEDAGGRGQGSGARR